MDATRISVARVVELGVPVSWVEAAAVLIEAVAGVRREGRSADEQPAAASWLLTRGGDLLLVDAAAPALPDGLARLGRELARACADPDVLGDAIRAGRLLGFLDDFSQRTTPAHRRAKIASIALRALATQADLERDRSGPDPSESPWGVGLEEPSGSPTVESPGWAAREITHASRGWGPREFTHPDSAVGIGRAPGRSRAGVVAAVASVVVGVALGAVVVRGLGLWPRLSVDGPTGQAAATAARARSAPAPPPSDARSADVPQTPAATLPEPPSPTAPPPTGVPAAIVPAAREAPPPKEPAAVPAPHAAPSAPAVAPRVQPVSPSSPVGGTSTVDAPIFSAAHPDVRPPALLSRAPAGVRVAWGSDVTGPALDLLIDRTGHVEDARVIGAPEGADKQRYRDMLQAARRWEFAPAQLNGDPVRCAVQLTMTP